MNPLNNSFHTSTKMCTKPFTGLSYTWLTHTPHDNSPEKYGDCNIPVYDATNCMGEQIGGSEHVRNVLMICVLRSVADTIVRRTGASTWVITSDRYHKVEAQKWYVTARRTIGIK